MRIYKYPLEIVDHQFLVLPEGAEILSVAEQNDYIVLYALVDEKETELDEIPIKIIGTGNPVENIEGYEFIGTVKIYGGKLVFHVFYQ